jgi:hypothetical protein
MTIEQLYELCKMQIQAGNGKKKIVISDDNEGNGYHGLFYGFTPVTEEFVDDIYDSESTSPDDTIILG